MAFAVVVVAQVGGGVACEGYAAGLSEEFGGLAETNEPVEQRCFAQPVGTDDAMEISLPHLEVEIPQNALLAHRELHRDCGGLGRRDGFGAEWCEAGGACLEQIGQGCGAKRCRSCLAECAKGSKKQETVKKTFPQVDRGKAGNCRRILLVLRLTKQENPLRALVAECERQNLSRLATSMRHGGGMGKGSGADDGNRTRVISLED